MEKQYFSIVEFIKVVSARLCRLATFISNFRRLKSNFRSLFAIKSYQEDPNELLEGLFCSR